MPHPPQAGAHDVVVVGASADGVQNLRALVAALPGDLPAAVFMVLHTGPGGGTLLPEILARAGSLPVAQAHDGEPVRPGRIYLPAPDCHLLLSDGHVQTLRGPRENRFRPAIDALFRSAARAYGTRVVGVILSGLLDDGAFGLRHVVDAGGVALVQDPAEASYPSMPIAALRLCPEATALPIAGIASRIALLARGRPEDAPRPAFVAASDNPGHGAAGKHPGPAAEPDPVAREDRLRTGDEGQPTVFTCPDCGGTLSEVVEGELVRYRCHVGHGFTPATLVDGQDHAVEEALWNALRALEESAAFRRRSSARAMGSGLLAIARGYDEQAGDIEERARVIRRVLARPLAAPTAPEGVGLAFEEHEE